MKEYLNILHYGIFIIERKLHFLSNKINPFLLLYRIPFVRKKFKTNSNIDNPLDWYNDFWTNEKDGFGLLFSGGWLVGVVFLYITSAAVLLMKKLNINFNSYYLIVFGIISFLLCYFWVFKKDTYLKYFQEYRSWKVNKKNRTILICGAVLLLALPLFILSLISE